MLIKTRSWPVKPPPGVRLDTTHPLGQKCQCVCLFNDGSDGQGMHVPGDITDSFMDCASVQIYQTLGNRQPRFWGSTIFGSAPPIWATNAAGKCIYFGGDFSGMDFLYNTGEESHDLDYPEFPIAGIPPIGEVHRGQTVCIIKRKFDTTARASTLFGVEGTAGIGPESRCGAHVPYSDGTVYWDYGGSGAPNRLTYGGYTITTNVEKWVFTAGPQGSAIWKDGIKLASQSTALFRVVTTPGVFNVGTMLLNAGNGLGAHGGGDLVEFNFVMFIADQWSDDKIEWWMAEPYAMFYEPFIGRQYFMIGTAGGGGASTERTTQISFD